MSILTVIRCPWLPSGRRPVRSRHVTNRLILEPLEDRTQPSFGLLATYDFGAGPEVGAPAAADFTGDGRLDLAEAGPAGIAVLPGSGNGTFQAARHSQPGGGGGTLRASDMNNDSRSDLVLRDVTDVRVMLGNGNGTFQASRVVALPSQVPPASPTVYPGTQTPVSFALGDVNSDGNVDLAVTVVARYSVVIGYMEYIDEYTGELIYFPLLQQHNVGYLNVLLGTGDGSFGPASVTGLGERNMADVDLRDFTGDGRRDVMLSFADYANELTVLPGNGNGTFQAARVSTVGGYLGDISQLAGDLDGDGDLDLLVQDWGLGAAGIAWGNGDGTFGLLDILFPATGVNTGSATAFTTGGMGAVGDIDADGDLDILGSFGWIVDDPEGNSYQANYVAVLLGDGGGLFTRAAAAPGTELYWNSALELLSDFTSDGLPDLVWAQSEFYPSGGFVSGTAFVAPNDGVWMPQPPPTVTIGDVTVTEGNIGNRVATFMVSLSAASGQPVAVAYATANGTATGGSDYQSTAGTVAFAPGETSMAMTIPVIGDRMAESNETFLVNLTSPTNATITDGQGQGTILDDEPRISIGDVSKAEGKKGKTTVFTFNVTLSAPYDQAVTMSYSTADGTAKTGDNDYTAKSGTITFAPGETTKTITIEVKGDSKKEANETFYLDLYGLSSNGLFTKNRGVGTILNDD